MQGSSLFRHRARLGRVLGYVDGHLTGNVDVETLGRVAAFSKFHFHRQFAAAFGMAVFRYVQLTRLKRAGYRLAFRADEPIIEIAPSTGRPVAARSICEVPNTGRSCEAT